ncbi:MAG: BtpA/SgcQ family protein [Candidatus Eisenbacteria sp.]|nr:BtpA/SgcQ family protein [Candidatus Eisenbacteria bacterium]
MDLLGIHKPLIGVVHLLPLPGAPRYGGSMKRVIDRAMADATAYRKGGMDGLLIENYGDTPFHAGRLPPDTIAAMTAVGIGLRGLGAFPLGINALRSDGLAALAIATAIDAQFIRVNVLAGAMMTDQGLIQGCAACLMRSRATLRARVEIWGDLLVKHAVPLAPQDPIDAATDLIQRAHADALILTGHRTGAPVAVEMLTQVRGAVPRSAVVIGSGIATGNLDQTWSLADGFIVGTSLKKGSRTQSPVDPARVERLVEWRKHLAGDRRRRQVQ